MSDAPQDPRALFEKVMAAVVGAPKEDALNMLALVTAKICTECEFPDRSMLQVVDGMLAVFRIETNAKHLSATPGPKAS